MRCWPVLLMALLLGVSTLPSQAYRLSYKDNAGEVRNYRMSMTMSGSASIMGMSMPLNGTLFMDSVEKVTGVRNGRADITNSYRNGKMTMVITVPGAEDDEQQTVQQAMPNFGVNYTRTPLGALTNIRYTGDLANTMPNETTVLNSVQNAQGIVFPDRDLQIGDSWSGNQDLDMGNGMRISVRMEYKLTGTRVVNGKTYLVIDCDSSATIPKMTINAQAGGEQGGGAATQPVTMSLKLNGKSTTLFDEAAGNYRESALSMNANVTMTGQGAGLGEPISMNLTLDGKIVRTN